MLVHAKKPRIKVKISGRGYKKVVELIKKSFEDVHIEEDETVNIFETKWYSDLEADSTPAEALKIYRTNASLTLVQLSEKSGIAESHLSAMECGKRSIGKISAQKLGKALNCNYHRFL